jgi:riboflavin transporter FmnP
VVKPTSLLVDSVKFRSRRYSPDERRGNICYYCTPLIFGGVFLFEVKNMKNQNVHKMTITAIMGAVGFILMMLEFPLAFMIPSFIKFDFSELPALITAFAVGPCWGVLVCLIKNVLHLFVGNTAGVGELSNFVLGAIFVFGAGTIYKKKKTRAGALIGSLVGAVLMAVISVATNYFFVYPIHAKMLIPMDAIIAMYSAILPKADTLI